LNDFELSTKLGIYRIKTITPTITLKRRFLSYCQREATPWWKPC